MSSVSVVVPCYNYAHYLRECVESVLSQYGVEVRVLIIDDASPDNTSVVAAALVSDDPRVEYRQHAKNLGHIVTYNEGLDWASGDYVVLLSADDLLTPGALQRATQLMDAHPEVGFVYGGCVKFCTGQLLPQARLPTESTAWQVSNGIDWLKSACETGNTWIVSPEVVVRTSLQHRVGGYLPELPHSGDMEMWMRLAVHAAVGHILNADQAFYRVHGKNMHTSQFSNYSQDIRERKAAFDFVFQNNGDLIPEWERFQKAAHRSLAGDALWAVCHAYIRREAAQTPIVELITYANSSYRGKFFSFEYLGVYYNVFSRILYSARTKLGLT